MTGPLVAEEIGGVLEEWRHTGWLPWEPHPITGAMSNRRDDERDLTSKNRQATEET